MDSLGLLRYWRGGGRASAATAAADDTNDDMRTTTIATSVLRPLAESDTEDDDEGPFFDLEFAAVPDEDSDGVEDEHVGGEENENEDSEEEREFKFAVSPDGHLSDPSLTLSPSDDLFFKGRLGPLEPSSPPVAAAEPDSKPPQLKPISLIRSATKLRVLMLRLRRPKPAPVEADAAAAASSKQQQQLSKFFVKFKVEEVPLVSLFTRDNSSRNTGRAAKPHAEDAAAAEEEERRSSKEVVQKYLNKIKPLYVRVSKRYGEKLRFSGSLSDSGEAGPDEKGEADGVKNQSSIVPAGLRVVCKRLGKSKSAPSAVAAVPSPLPSPPSLHRRDDSLLQQQDGIQSAIAHCKRSFNVARGKETPLARAKSDSGDGIQVTRDCV